MAEVGNLAVDFLSSNHNLELLDELTLTVHPYILFEHFFSPFTELLPLDPIFQ